MLNTLRSDIDKLDLQLLSLLSKRMQICREIGNYKQQQGLPVMQQQRFDEMLQQRLNYARKLGFDTDFTIELFNLIHKESLHQQTADTCIQ